jgi:FkbM family methyltransferase
MSASIRFWPELWPGARCIAAEPVPATYADLLANIRINGIEPRCRVEKVAVGAASGFLRVTTGLDAMNHVIPAEESGNGASFVEVPVRTLDDVVGGAAVTVLKIDVEGFEREVLAGGGKTLADPSLLLVIMEVNYCTGRYGYDGALLHQRMAGLGFQTFRYLPRERTLVRSEIAAGFNVVFVRHLEAFEQRLRSAPQFEIQRLGVKI